MLHHTELALSASRMPTMWVLLWCRLYRMAYPTSQRPILIVPTASWACHDSVKADKLNMSGDVWKRRLSDLLWNFARRSVVSLGWVSTLQSWSHFKEAQPSSQILWVLRCLCAVLACVFAHLSAVGKWMIAKRWLGNENEGEILNLAKATSVGEKM